jgi:hypothetical protein
VVNRRRQKWFVTRTQMGTQKMGIGPIPIPEPVKAIGVEIWVSVGHIQEVLRYVVIFKVLTFQVVENTTLSQ